MPQVFTCPDPDLNNSLMARFEKEIDASPRFRKYVLFLGAIEVERIPAGAGEIPSPDDVRLIDLPSRIEAEDFPGTPAHMIATNQNGFEMVEAAEAAPDLIRSTMLTMARARQFEYLHASGIPWEEWKVLVEVHYYRERSKITSEFHRDTFGETLFVNLAYATSHPIAGPEYILNPPVVGEHEEQIARTLPKEFLDDLGRVRGKLGEPDVIDVVTVPPNGVVAFVDEAVNHMTPHYGHRTVKGSEVEAFLRRRHGDDRVEDALAAYRDLAKKKASLGAPLRSLVSTPKPFSGYLKVIPPEEADTWFHLAELIGKSNEKFARPHLLDAGMSEQHIDELLAESRDWQGYQQVSIPGAQAAPAARTPLKRQMSANALKGQVPAEVTGDRRFFRINVRIVRR
ncbi:hypothetical protein AB0G02_39580 [Actinosynnema sp. NPDC023658]|uniref:hypothetical protein n=1 Tax=Actinosynnema sp. NPDC023658 TaxID=3155465 RepID=UPI003402A5C5